MSQLSNDNQNRRFKCGTCNNVRFGKNMIFCSNCGELCCKTCCKYINPECLENDHIVCKVCIDDCVNCDSCDYEYQQLYEDYQGDNLIDTLIEDSLSKINSS